MIGRLCDDPETRYTQGQQPTAVSRYRLAVDRKIKREGEQNADFINCVAFGKNGEFAEKYLHKGTKIAVCGRIQTSSYTNREGRKVYTTDIVVEEHCFCEKREGGGYADQRQEQQPPSYNTDENGFMTDIPDDIAEELPFVFN